MRKLSNKLAGNLRIYRTLRRDYLIDHPVCEIGEIGCSYNSTQIHHKKGRGKYLTEVSTFVACCFYCHRWVEENPALAKQKGLSESRLSK